MCDLDPKVKVLGQKAGICDGVPLTSTLVSFKIVVLYILVYWSKENFIFYTTSLKIIAV